MTLTFDQKTFVIETPTVITYDVGREGIGMVSRTFNAGEVIVGQERDGKVRYVAQHEANGKMYNTPVFLDPSKFKVASQVEIDDRKISKREASGLAMLIFGITLALLFSRGSK